MKNEDYLKIPWVAETIQNVKTMLGSDNPDKVNAAKTCLFEEGQELLLHVRVNQPFLFQRTVGSIFYNYNCLHIPGADLLGVDVDSAKLRPREKVLEWLRQQVSNMEKELENGG